MQSVKDLKTIKYEEKNNQNYDYATEDWYNQISHLMQHEYYLM